MGDPTMKYICWSVMTNNLHLKLKSPKQLCAWLFCTAGMLHKRPTLKCSLHREDRCMCHAAKPLCLRCWRGLAKRKEWWWGRHRFGKGWDPHVRATALTVQSFTYSLLTVRFTVLCISIHGLLWDKCGCVKCPNTSNFKQTAILVCWEGPIRVTSFISLIICKKQ